MPGNSLIHTLDARTKMICLLLLAAAVVSVRNMCGYALLVLVTGSIVRLAGLPLSTAWAAVRRLTPFFGVILLMNALFFHGERLLWSWLFLRVYAAGVRQGVAVVANVALIMVLCHVLMLTTPPLETTRALQSLIKPLRRIGVPTEDVALIISVAVRFIPTLWEEADMIMKAQIARGAKCESRKFVERAASYLPLIIPVFIAAFRRADELATAMEARGYRGGKQRTQRSGKPLRRQDYAAVTLCAAVCVMQYVVSH